VLTWVLVPFLAIKFGFNGAALGYALVGSSSLIAIFVTKRFVNFSLTDSVLKPLGATLVMGSVLFVLRMALPINFYSLSILILVGIATYGVLMIAIIGISLIEDAKRSFKTIFSR